MQYRARKLLLAMALVYTPLAVGGKYPLPANELKITFNNHQPALYTQKQLAEDWHNVIWDGTQNRARVLRDPQNPRNHVLRVKYPANVVGPWHSGSQFFAQLPPHDEYWLTYRVRFQQGFDFKKGGKLPGLGSGDGRYAGGRKPYNGDGWTARLMWKEDGTLIPYLYYVGMPKTSRFGHHWPINANIRRGHWHEVTQRVRVNTPGRRNGLYEIWMDGRLMTRKHDMIWRSGNKAPVDAFFFSTFHGGAGYDWAPRWDSYIDFDDITISRHMPLRIRRALMAMR